MKNEDLKKEDVKLIPVVGIDDTGSDKVFAEDEKEKNDLVIRERELKGRLYTSRDKAGREIRSVGQVDITGKFLWYDVDLTQDDIVTLKLNEDRFFKAWVVEKKSVDVTKTGTYIRLYVQIGDNFKKPIRLSFQAQQNFKKILDIK